MRQIFTYKDKEYFIESYTQIKDRSSREWYVGVNYISAETGTRYTRELGDFRSKFEEV